MQHLLYLTFLLTFNFREFLGQVWMKEDKKEKAQNICLITERFNDVSIISISRLRFERHSSVHKLFQNMLGEASDSSGLVLTRYGS